MILPGLDDEYTGPSILAPPSGQEDPDDGSDVSYQTRPAGGPSTPAQIAYGRTKSLVTNELKGYVLSDALKALGNPDCANFFGQSSDGTTAAQVLQGVCV
jgi:hypothetical protein